MSEFLITRRQLLKAGLAASVISLIPSPGLCVQVSTEDLEPIGPNAKPDKPYNENQIGELSAEYAGLITLFSGWAISSWKFSGMDEYSASLSSILNLKTSQEPSYLKEYESAAKLVKAAKERMGSEEEAFLYLLFTNRGEEGAINTRLGRAQKFVFDEIVRHLVANGGFKSFGFVNYQGHISVPFTDPRSYRRTAV